MGDLKSQLQRLKAQIAEVQKSAAGIRTRPQAQGAPSSSIPPPPADTAKAGQRVGPPRTPITTAARSAPQEVQKQPTITPVPSRFEPLPRSGRERAGAFMSPAPWVGAGGRTQMEGATGREIDVVIGLDFGTSFTKAAVGLLDVIYPVTWEGVTRFEPSHLLPSEYSTGLENSVRLGQRPSAEGFTCHADLKLPFINNMTVTSDELQRASTYLALVLRYIRAWVYRHHSAKIAGSRIRWQLNMGSPSNGLEHDDVAFTYSLLGRSAWRRSILEDPDRVGEFAATEESPSQDLLDLQIKPEFVAQIAGYVQSSQRQRGLHALVDIGGGTMDVVTFIVHKVDGEDTFPFLVPEVRPLGTHGVIQNRLLAPSMIGRSISVDELAPLPTAQEFATLTGAVPGQIYVRDEMFAAVVQATVKRVFETTKQRRYRMALAWDVGVRTFFTGGGSAVPLYQTALSSVRTPSPRPLNLMPLPLHPRLESAVIDSSEYQRMSVACGLAQDAFTLGRNHSRERS